jgi:hypothetical protein
MRRSRESDSEWAGHECREGARTLPLGDNFALETLSLSLSLCVCLCVCVSE